MILAPAVCDFFCDAAALRISFDDFLLAPASRVQVGAVFGIDFSNEPGEEFSF